MKNNENIVTSEELAKVLRISKRTVQSLAQQGIITCRKVGTKNEYDLYVVVNEYFAYLAKKAERFSAPDNEEELEAEIRLKRAKADMAELELEEIRGSLYAAEDVEKITNDLIWHIKSAVLSLPEMLAPELAGIDSAAEASEIIKKAVYDVLGKLADYKYDPEEYARRIEEEQRKEDSSEGGVSLSGRDD